MQKIRKLTKSIKTEGNIRSMRDVSELKSTIESYNLVSGNQFNIEIVDSFAMPSALIGYLLKLVQQDAVKLSLNIYDTRLAELLDDLNLTEVFNIRCKASA
ncbi:MAG TPA: hypothetical protein EYG95_02675 [Campylobacterales bacterium]|nr:hypothetical protein [Campylobacterales bacterium]